MELVVGHGLPTQLRFENFVCQNERIWTLKGACAWATGNSFHCSLYNIFPSRVPENGTQELTDLLKHINIELGDGQSAGQQAGYQIAALATSMVMAIVGGSLTGSNENYLIFCAFTGINLFHHFNSGLFYRLLQP